MNKLLKVSGALNDETRILILAFLIKHGECCVCELSASLELGQSRISRHLGILLDANLLSTNRAGKWVYYVINSHPDELAQAILKSILLLNIKLPAKVEACNIKNGEKL